MKLKVVFTTTVFDKVNTGPGIYAQTLWNAFKDDSEIEFHMVAPASSEKHPRLHTLQADDPGLTLYHRIANKAHKLIKGQEQIILIHGNSAHSMFSFVTYPGKLAVQINDYEVADVWKLCLKYYVEKGHRRLVSLIWRYWQEKKVVKAADVLVCNSNYTKQKMLSTYKVNPEKCIVVYPFVDLEGFFKPEILPPDPLPLRSKGCRLIMTGTNWQIKGLDYLIEAVRVIKKEIPQISLIVAGSKDIQHNSKIIESVNRTDLRNSIKFVGRLDRNTLAQHLWHSDLFVLPSLQEAFGISILEAMAAGLPVVATNVGGIPEIITNESDGVFCMPKNYKSIAQAVMKLINDESLRTAISRKGRQRVDCFSKDSMIDSIRKMYHSI